MKTKSNKELLIDWYKGNIDQLEQSLKTAVDKKVRDVLIYYIASWSYLLKQAEDRKNENLPA